MMNRQRTIPPSVFEDEIVGDLDPLAWITLVGLFYCADDYGRGPLNSRLIYSRVWTYKPYVSVDAVEEHLLLISERKLIGLYVAEGREFFEMSDRLWIPVRSPSKSEIPPPPWVDASCQKTDFVHDVSIYESAQSPRRVRADSEYRGSRSVEGRECEGAEGREGGLSAGLEQQERGHEGAGESLGLLEHVGEPPCPPWCEKHPGNSSKFPCRECGSARKIYDYWRVTGLRP